MKTIIEGQYSIFTNADQEIMLAIHSRENEPENSRIIYDGGDHALFYRNKEETVLLDYINFDVREKLQNTKTLIVVEFESQEENNTDIESEPVRAYDVNLQMVKKLPLSGELAEIPTMDELFEVMDAELDEIVN